MIHILNSLGYGSLAYWICFFIIGWLANWENVDKLVLVTLCSIAFIVTFLITF